MSEKRIYNIGVIGAGMIARDHLVNLQRTGRANITWIAHRNMTKLEKVAAEFSVPNLTGDIYAIHHNSIGHQSRPGVEYHPTARWFLNKAIAGGGPLFDWGVYDLSFHLGVLGDRREVEFTESRRLMSGLDGDEAPVISMELTRKHMDIIFRRNEKAENSQ